MVNPFEYTSQSWDDLGRVRDVPMELEAAPKRIDSLAIAAVAELHRLGAVG